MRGAAWDAQGQTNLSVTIAWMDDSPLLAGRTYWVLQGHRWVKAKIESIENRRNIHTLAQETADSLLTNEIGTVTLKLQEPLLTLPFQQSRTLGALILVDASSHKTSAAALVL